MCYTNYNEWTEYVEHKYSSVLLKKNGGDIKTWFNTIKTEEMEEEINNYHLGGDCPEISMIVATIAWCFDNSNYNEKTHKSRSTCNGDRTRYSAGEGIFASLRKNWDKSDTKYKFSQIQLDIPSENNEGTYNWIEMCSALQKRYGIFSCLDDLNKFVFDVGSASVFSNYGFYMRDLTHICLAYAIMHGYSVDEEKLLLQRAIESVENARREVSREERSAKNTYTEEAREVFEKWFKINIDQVKSFKCGDKNEKKFIQALSDNSKYIIKNINGYNHWSALKIVLDTLLQNNDDDECVEDIERKFKDRLLALYGEVADLNDIDMTWVCGLVEKHSLREYLIKSLGIDKMARIYKVASNATQKFSADNETPDISERKQDAKYVIADSLRYIYIVALMKQIKNQECCETAMAVIEQVNEKLAEAGMRDIEDFSKIGNNAVPIDMPQDFVDGFIVECICYEEKLGFDIVSGFDTFMQYLLKRT